jgi:signal transduction histidine kinase
VTQVFRSGHARYVSSIDQKTDAHAFLRDLGLTEAMVAPLQVESMNVGVIIVGDPYAGAFSEQQLEQFASLAAPAGLVLSQIGRYEAQAEMTRRLEEVAKMKTDFVSVVSHELRTPLTSIIGSLDTVNRPELSPPQPASRRLISTARRQASRLQRLIEDLLVVSRIDRGAVPVQAEAISVEALFADIARTVSALEPTIKVEPADLEVRADPDHIHRIFINLLENASKYAEGSDVELYGWARHDRAVLAVVDHGPGIPAGERERVFERFTQMDQSETRTKGGTGLGLSIVKSLTEVMSGTVRVEETDGGGATFVVELPLARSNVPV